MTLFGLIMELEGELVIGRAEEEAARFSIGPKNTPVRANTHGKNRKFLQVKDGYTKEWDEKHGVNGSRKRKKA